MMDKRILASGLIALFGAITVACSSTNTKTMDSNYIESRRRELEPTVPTQKTDRGMVLTLRGDDLFETHRATLKTQAKQTLAELARLLAKYPNDRMRIAGVMDHAGMAGQDANLATERADAVRRSLASNGVRNRMNTVGRGEFAQPSRAPASRATDGQVAIYINVAPQKPATSR